MTMLPTASDLPKLLVEYDQWVCWREQTRGDNPTKVPVNPHTGRFASATDDETWGSFETAREYAVDGSAEGLGFVFCDDDPFVGVDLDDARDPETGTPTDWAKSIIDELNSYTEISPSGTGYHVLVDGELPPGRNRRGDVELYETARFFTVTANHVETTPTGIIERTTALAGVYADHVADEDEHEKTDGEPNTESSGGDNELTGAETSSAEASASPNEALSDEELLARARAASNSAKFEQLWRGDTHGYDSQSEADMALACLLAFWTGGDTHRMDRLFRRSGLMREKWDAVHYADGSTYGEKTIERANNVTTEYYSPNDEHDQQTQTDPDDGADDLSVNSATASASVRNVQPSKDEGTIYEREQARIETITRLEQRLRELEEENERLREERDAERAKRKALEDDNLQESSPTGIIYRLKQILSG
ncbi:hypothetical protein M0R89_03870 [Halorussus limi]|uniref:NrS-1 polymerase-like HBD domain-containing protein n=1 Tax=Halorussus limi TaxID=2938695 RepID=A0A8U0HWR4_9EURY|nr:hypothetical protein [Halorussus limi]UPV75213.1 hypothetical protein M0R89_03870 [Halorussus limi]